MELRPVHGAECRFSRIDSALTTAELVLSDDRRSSDRRSFVEVSLVARVIYARVDPINKCCPKLKHHLVVC